MSPKNRFVLDRDNWTCQYCGTHLTEQTQTVDHVIPKHSGGSNHVTNLRACCRACNTQKHRKDVEGFRLHLSIQASPYRGLVSAHDFPLFIAAGADFGPMPEITFFFERGAVAPQSTPAAIGKDQQ